MTIVQRSGGGVVVLPCADRSCQRSAVLAATSAVAEDDDDNVAALETWIETARRVREFRFEPEYNFDPRNAIRLELAAARDRRFETPVRTRGAEVEFKHLFTDLARSGFGSGLMVGVDWDDRRGGDEDNERNWALGSAGLATLRPTPDTLLHFNLGAVKESGEPARARWAVARALCGRPHRRTPTRRVARQHLRDDRDRAAGHRLVARG